MMMKERGYLMAVGYEPYLSILPVRLKIKPGIPGSGPGS